MPLALFQDELFASRSRPLDALAYLADAPAASRGAVHTRPEVAEFVLDLAGWTIDHDLTHARLLEPSAGEGDFLLPAVHRLLSRSPGARAKDLAPCIRAVEVNTQAIQTCRARMIELFQLHGWKAAQAGSLLDQWLIQADFLTVPLEAGFTHIVGTMSGWSISPKHC